MQTMKAMTGTGCSADAAGQFTRNPGRLLASQLPVPYKTEPPPVKYSSIDRSLRRRLISRLSSLPPILALWHLRRRNRRN